MSALQNGHEYFDAIAALYRQRRGGLFSLSRSDWELIDAWQNDGVPLDVVLKSIDLAFGRASVKQRHVNGLSYCLRVVAELIEEHKKTHVERPEVLPISGDRIRRYLDGLASLIEAAPIAGNEEVVGKAAAIAELVRLLDPAASMLDLESALGQLEGQLFKLLQAATLTRLAAHLAVEIHEELKPYRSTMTADQLVSLEQHLQRRKVLEHYKMPRLTMFFLDMG